jgi:hypothetical protein
MASIPDLMPTPLPLFEWTEALTHHAEKLITGELPGLKVRWHDPGSILPMVERLAEARWIKYRAMYSSTEEFLIIPTEDATITILIRLKQSGIAQAAESLCSGYVDLIRGVAAKRLISKGRTSIDWLDQIVTNVLMGVEAKFDADVASYFHFILEETKAVTKLFLSTGDRPLPGDKRKPNTVEDPNLRDTLRDDSISTKADRQEGEWIRKATDYPKPFKVIQAAAEEHISRVVSLDRPPNQILATLLVQFAGFTAGAVVSPPSATMNRLLELFLNSYCHEDHEFERHIGKICSPLKRRLENLESLGGETPISFFISEAHEKGVGQNVSIWVDATMHQLRTKLRSEERDFLRCVCATPVIPSAPRAHKVLSYCLVVIVKHHEPFVNQLNQELFWRFRERYCWMDKQLTDAEKKTTFRFIEEQLLLASERSLRPINQWGSVSKWVSEVRNALINKWLCCEIGRRQGLLFGFNQLWLLDDISEGDGRIQLLEKKDQVKVVSDERSEGLEN